MTDRPTPARDHIQRLLEAGLTAREVAGARGISIQAVHVHIKKLRAAGWRPPREREE